MSDGPTPSNHRDNPTNESTDEEHRSINERYRFWKHPQGDEPEVVNGEVSLGRAPGEKAKGKEREKEAPGKMTWGYKFTLSESPERLEQDSTHRQISTSLERGDKE